MSNTTHPRTDVYARVTDRITAFITWAPTACQILVQPSDPTSPPRIAPARRPPLWKNAGCQAGRVRPRHNRQRDCAPIVRHSTNP
jgi:hypothetical protein